MKTKYLLCSYGLDPIEGDFLRHKISKPYGSNIISRCPKFESNEWYVTLCISNCHYFGGIKEIDDEE